jgi:phosphoribosyl-ATP pyrophosphohydrolase
MPMLKAGYSKTTTPLKTAAGKDSAIRGLDPKGSTVILDDTTEQEVAAAVTKYVLEDTAEKAAKEAKEKAGEVIRLYASTVRDENALCGDYQKTLRVLGTKVKDVQYAVDAAHQDKFSVPKSKDDIEAIRKILGPLFESVFEETTEISIKDSVLKNDTLRKELSQLLFKALGTEGIKKYFDRDTTWTVKKGMAEDQFKLDKVVREVLKTKVPQAKDSLKDASDKAA